VVAEGVEYPAQLALLRTMGCDVAQGFCVSPPVNALKFSELMRTRSAEAPAPAGAGKVIDPSGLRLP